MRAIYLTDIEAEIDAEISIGNESFHHLVKVARVKARDEILILNGLGLVCSVEIVEIQKKQIIAIVRKIDKKIKKTCFDLIVGNCKKEYLEQILRMSVEIGVDHISLFKSEYSQSQDLREDRMEKILISALEQSNNPFMPTIENVNSAIELEVVCSEYDCILWFNSRYRGEAALDFERIKKSQKVAILIGPEGGFSSNEEFLMSNLPQFIEIHLEGPIMKAVTAVPVAAGYLLACKAKNY